MMPANAIKRHVVVEKRIEDLTALAENCEFNTVEELMDIMSRLNDKINTEINSTAITPIKLESVYINAIGNNFVSYLENPFSKGMYLVNISGGNSLKLIAHNNVIPTSQFTSPLPIYNFTNYTSATNLL